MTLEVMEGWGSENPWLYVTNTTHSPMEAGAGAHLTCNPMEVETCMERKVVRIHLIY